MKPSCATLLLGVACALALLSDGRVYNLELSNCVHRYKCLQLDANGLSHEGNCRVNAFIVSLAGREARIPRLARFVSGLWRAVPETPRDAIDADTCELFLARICAGAARSAPDCANSRVNLMDYAAQQHHPGTQAVIDMFSDYVRQDGAPAQPRPT